VRTELGRLHGPQATQEEKVSGLHGPRAPTAQPQQLAVFLGSIIESLETDYSVIEGLLQDVVGERCAISDGEGVRREYSPTLDQLRSRITRLEAMRDMLLE
jgi:hypothetical protein